MEKSASIHDSFLKHVSSEASEKVLIIITSFIFLWVESWDQTLRHEKLELTRVTNRNL